MNNERLSILLADDEKTARTAVGNFLGRLNYLVDFAEDGRDALLKLREKTYDVLLLDICMPNMTGLELLRQLKDIEQSGVEVIMTTGRSSEEYALEALKYGAFRYLKKPIDVRELADILSEVSRRVRFSQQCLALLKSHRQEAPANLRSSRLREEMRKACLDSLGLANISIASDAMTHVIKLAEKYREDASIPILIEGESGTGKDIVARYTHYFTMTSDKAPFVAINCAAISGGLFESEMFGHEKGAFTGATTTGKQGKIEAANNGTLFLDEVADIPPEFQVKLLRVLEEGSVCRLGSVQNIALNIRLISATNKNLFQEVREGRFREDLYYRISGASIYIPPLRERVSDIVPLANNFAEQACQRQNKAFCGFAATTQKLLESYSWPGNIRQLKHVIDNVMLFSVGMPITPADFKKTGWLRPGSTAIVTAPDTFTLPDGAFNLHAHMHQVIEKAFDKNTRNKTATARYLGISLRVLQGYLKKYSIE